jgi:hypothetical protein
MPADVIQVTGLNVGPIGKISQTDFPIITPRQVNSADTLNVNFGDPVVLNTNNTYSSVAQYIADAKTLTSSTPLAVAVADVKTNSYYPLAGGQSMGAGYYSPGNLMDALVRGTINVNVRVGTPAGSQAPVYVRVATNVAIPAGVVGGFEAAADGTNTVLITNMVFKTGSVGPDGSAQIVLLERTMA